MSKIGGDTSAASPALVQSGQAAVAAGKAKGKARAETKTTTPLPLSGATKNQLLLNALPELASPTLDQQVLVNILKKLSVDLSQSTLAGEVETIKFDQNRLQTLAKENIKKLQHVLKAIAKRKKAGLLGKIFSWIAAAIGTVLGAVFAVATFGSGSVLAGVMITMSTTLAVSLTIASATGGADKMAAELAKAFENMLTSFGMDPKKAKSISKIMAQVTIAVIVIAVQVMMLVMTGGASAENFAQEMVNKIASFTIKATSIAMGYIQLASAGTSTAAGVYNYQSLQSQADIADNKAFLQKMHSVIEAEQDMIQELINIITKTQTNMANLIKSENENRGMLANIDGMPSAV